MMRIVPLLLIVLLACGAVADAQVRLGILGGLHSANIKETNNIAGWDSTVHRFQSGRSGGQIGVIVEVPLGHSWFFQPAILYSSKGRKYQKSNDSATSVSTDTVYYKQNLNLNYIDIPLNFTYKMPLSANHKNNFFISAGPQISFFYSGKLGTETLTNSTSKYSSESDPVTVGSGVNSYKTVDLGINGRAGFELGNVMLSAYFSRGLTNIYHASYDGTFHNQVFGASLGIWLTSTNPQVASTPKPHKPRNPHVSRYGQQSKKDSDQDGIPDAQDACPLQAGTAKYHGCPVPDTDKDGINDEQDSCKTIPGLARYHGCPIPDTDKDGVNDEDDSCKTVPGLARYHGCPIPDRDGDGVNDEEDQCPDSAGPVENHGCPIVKPEIKKEATEKINYIARNILFNSSSDELTDNSFIALDSLASLMKEHPEWYLAIEGYTDNVGKPEKNLQLSHKRAQVVLDYLNGKGVESSRLTATGYGQEKPIADNKTVKGRAANRRVELRITLEK